MLTIYKASAGSGKTYNLALTYIRHLLTDPSAPVHSLRPYKGAAVRNHRSILAITFTNAATEEMKTRIIKRLAQLAENPAESDYYNTLNGTGADSFKVEPEVLKAAAAHALSELLYDYSAFNVSTIDSFFQTVLRTFAREVDRQGDYELSLDQKTIIPAVINLMLEELNRNPDPLNDPLYQWILRKAQERNELGQTLNFFDRESSLITSLADDVDHSMEEVYHSYGAELDDYFAEPERLQAFVEEVQKRLKALYKAIKQAGVPILKLMSTYEFDNLKPVFVRVVKQSVNPRVIDTKDVESSTVAKIAEDPLKNMATGKAEFRKKLDRATQEDFAEKASVFCNLLIDSAPAIALYNELSDGALHLQFIALFRRELAKYLRENNTLLIADTGELLKRIISDSEMPFIYERIGTVLSSLLIDEFQDTSRLQWHNLKPLVTNSIAQSSSLIIGDVKQSIYRFRNSDSSLLDTQVEDDPDFAGRTILKGTAPEESTNRRSAHDIVRFNNTLFGKLGKMLGVSSYDTVAQHLAKNQNYPAAINLVLELKPNSSSDVDKEKNLEWRMETLASNILDQHSRGYKWKDIAILVNTHKQGREIVSYFLEHFPDIRILSNEALLLSNSPAVRSVMSVLALVSKDIVENPRVKNTGEDDPEEIRQAAIHSRADLTALLNHFSYARSKGASHQDALLQALDNIENNSSGALQERVRNIRSKHSTNLVALLENIISEELDPEDRSTQHAFLTALQDRAVAHCLGPDPSVRAFLKAYDLNINRWAIKAPNSLDAVKVMTIHASKGLEWPCVHVPYANWKLFKGDDIWFTLKNGLPAQKDIFDKDFDPGIVPPIIRLRSGNKAVSTAPVFQKEAEENKNAEILDNLNKLYVALTRAARELYVLFSYNSKITKDSTHDCVRQILTEALEGEASGPVSAMEMPLRVTVEEGNEAHSELLRIVHHTTGKPEEYVEPGNGSDKEVEQEITAPYVVVPRAGIDELVAVENLSDVENTDIGIEETKEIDDDSDIAAEKINEATSRAAVRGTHLHAVLAEMATRDDLDRALDKLRLRQQLDPATLANYRDILEKAFRYTPQAKEWFDPANKVWSELSFFDPEAGDDGKGGILRPDRIVHRPDGSVVVIDFKFVNSPTTEQLEEYHSQVAGYMDLLTRMGYANVKGYLWFPRKNKVIEITLPKGS